MSALIRSLARGANQAEDSTAIVVLIIAIVALIVLWILIHNARR